MGSRISKNALAPERACLHESYQVLDEKLELMQANIEALRAEQTSLRHDFVLLQSHPNSTWSKIEEIEVSAYEHIFPRESLTMIVAYKTQKRNEIDSSEKQSSKKTHATSEEDAEPDLASDAVSESIARGEEHHNECRLSEHEGPEVNEEQPQASNTTQDDKATLPSFQGAHLSGPGKNKAPLSLRDENEIISEEDAREIAEFKDAAELIRKVAARADRRERRQRRERAERSERKRRKGEHGPLLD
jgi:hypothetical protein